MGGSGGGFFHGSGKKNGEELARKVRESEAASRDERFDSEITSEINTLLSKVNDRDTELIQKHLGEIRKALESEIDGYLTFRYGGSVSRHTYVDGLSDIDSLVVLNNSELLNKSPNEVKEYFYDRLKKRYPNTEIKKGNLAITLKYSDGSEIQLLPAVKKASGFKIAQDSQNWSNIVNPKKFALSLRASNINMSGKLLPVIKLAKSIISKFPDNRKLSGYHTEAAAIEAFSKYTGRKYKKDMLKFFFKKASNIALKPIKDKTGQSVNVDSYLGPENSLQRKMVADSLAQISRKMDNADASKLKQKWIEILK